MKIFNKADYEIEEDVNGKEALKKAELEKSSLIILDVNLPVITGFEVEKLLKYSPIINFIQILIYAHIIQERRMSLRNRKWK